MQCASSVCVPRGDSTLPGRRVDAIRACSTTTASVGVVASATAGVAAKELLDEVTATPHTESFANALNAGGVILWVACTNHADEHTAKKILEKFGGHNVHTHQRTR